MRQPWDTALTLCAVENVCLDLKKVLCDGSFLKGYTPKPIGDIDVSEVRRYLDVLKKRVADFEVLVEEV